MGKGGKKVHAGFEYFASFAGAVCLGPVDELLAIYNGGSLIWEGPLGRDSADSRGRTTVQTDFGPVRFYWGAEGQQVDEWMAGTLLIDTGDGPEVQPHPSYPGLCYFVAEHITFGESTSPPNLSFEVARYPERLDISAHRIDGDAVVPEVLFDLLTDRAWGAQVDPAQIDLETFRAAAELVIAEKIGVSPVLEDSGDLRGIAKQLLEAIDGHVYWSGDKMRLFMARAGDDLEGVPEVSEVDLLDEPELSNAGWESTWNITLLEFRDAANKHERTVEVYTDLANLAITGVRREKRINMEWIRSREVARRIVAGIGQRGGLPRRSGTLRLSPEWRGLKEGQLLRFSYAAWGLSGMLLRVMERRLGDMSSPDVVLDVIEDFASDPAVSLTEGEDLFSPPASTTDTSIIPATVRLGTLPPALKNGAVDGLLIAAGRTGPLVTSQRAWFSWDPSQVDYAPLAEMSGFAAAAEVLWWKPIRGGNWLLRVELGADAEIDRMDDLGQALETIYLVVGQRDYLSGGIDSPRPMPAWAARHPGGIWEAVSGRVWDIEVVGEAHGTPPFSLPSGTPGLVPTQACYVGRLEDFLMVTSDSLAFDRPLGNHPADTELKRHVKVSLANFAREEDVLDAGSAIYDQPSETSDPTWGPRVPTAYELTDEVLGVEVDTPGEADGYLLIEEIDDALGAMLEEEETAEQTFRFGDVDGVLGAII